MDAGTQEEEDLFTVNRSLLEERFFLALGLFGDSIANSNGTEGQKNLIGAIAKYDQSPLTLHERALLYKQILDHFGIDPAADNHTAKVPSGPPTQPSNDTSVALHIPHVDENI